MIGKIYCTDEHCQRYLQYLMGNTSLICVTAAIVVVAIVSLFLPPELVLSQYWGPIETKEDFFVVILAVGISAAVFTPKLLPIIRCRYCR